VVDEDSGGDVVLAGRINARDRGVGKSDKGSFAAGAVGW
jgi:hypothetical protein